MKTKSITLLLASSILSVSIMPGYIANATEIQTESIEQFANEEKEELLGEYIEYTNESGEVIVELYNPEIHNNIKTRNSYRETTTYKVYNQGITKQWSWTSNPYFIISIARGMTYEKSKNVSGTVSATFSSGLNETAVKKSIANTFGLSGSYSKNIGTKVTFSGPSGNNSRRDFYYKLGRHDHSVKVVREVRANQGIGLISSKTYTGTVGIPAIQTYSTDYR